MNKKDQEAFYEQISKADLHCPDSAEYGWRTALEWERKNESQSQFFLKQIEEKRITIRAMCDERTELKTELKLYGHAVDNAMAIFQTILRERGGYSSGELFGDAEIFIKGVKLYKLDKGNRSESK